MTAVIGPGDREPEAAAARDAALRREARVLGRYLLGVDPTGYAIERYLAAHRARPELSRQRSIDRLLLRLAVARPFPTRASDAYARIFAPRSLLRRKLTMLLAILESSPGLYARVDRVARVDRIAAASRPVLVSRLAGQLALWLLALAAGIVVLAPLHLLSRVLEHAPKDVGPETCQPPPRGRE